MEKAEIDKIAMVVRSAAEGPPPSFAFGDVLTGFSGERLLACLHGLTAALCGGERVYVEIGVFQGLTLLSTAQVNPGVACFGIDDFSLFNEGRRNFEIVNDRMARLGVRNATILNRDFELALHGLDRELKGREIGVLFVDGPHDYRSQLVSLLKSKPYLAESCAIVIDDANYAHVRQANADFLRSHPDYALLMEAYTPGHMANLSAAERERAEAGFWNGVNVIVHDPSHVLPRAYPREEPKDLYFQSHEVFRHEFAELAFPAMKAFQELLDDAQSKSETVTRTKTMFAEHRQRHPDRFRHQNTASAGLPGFVLYA